MDRVPRSTDRPRLSVCLIVKNEERLLPGCLDSVRGLADELVVVDTGSTDATRAIAERHGARLLSFDWIGDFSAARNASLAAARGTWILALDADDRLAPGQQGLLDHLLEDEDAGGFIVWIEEDYHQGDSVIHHRYGYPRLFRNHPEIRYTGRAHEQVAPSIERLGLPIRPSTLRILHLGYGDSLQAVRLKAERNLELLRAQLEGEPNNGYVHFQVGNSLDVLGRPDEAEAALVRALAAGVSDEIGAAAFAILASIHARRQQFGQAEAAARESLNRAPHQQVARWYLGVALRGQERWAEAAAAFGDLQASPSNHTGVGSESGHDVNIDRWKVTAQLAECTEHLGRLEEAARHFRSVVEENRTWQPAWDGLLRLQLRGAGTEPNPSDVLATLHQAVESRALSLQSFTACLGFLVKAGRSSDALRLLERRHESVSGAIPANVEPKLVSLQRALERNAAAPR